jgi:ankyrin repeat protein
MADRLISAAKQGNMLDLRRAMLTCADLNCVDSQGWTPLFHAAHRGNGEAVKLLIQAGADVNHGADTGFTALFSAVMGGRVETVRALLGAGARVVPVGGIELRGYAQGKNRSALVAILDKACNPPSTCERG